MKRNDIKIDFDIRGNLRPYEKITIDLASFKSHFVDSSADDNQKRIQIFNDYQRFIDAFSQEITDNFIQWIDGSFITKKKSPRDIDFVTLINHKIYEKYETIIENKFRRQPAQEAFGLVDAYVIKMYSLNHSRRWVSDHDLVYWRRWFTETKKNRAKKKFSKGFIEIQFGNDKAINDE